MPHCPRRINCEPSWHPIQRYDTTELPRAFRPWLLDESSLTAHLCELNGGALGVERIYQGWHLPLASERRLLGIAPRQWALIREVGLSLAHQTVVFARTIMPITSLSGNLGHLRYLKNEPLGAILFRHPGIQRSSFELTRIAGDSDYLPAHLRQELPVWGRRSQFTLEGKRLMVSELFLNGYTNISTGF